MVNQPNIGREQSAAEQMSPPDLSGVLLEADQQAAEYQRTLSNRAIAALACGGIAVWGTVITGGVAVAKEMRQMQQEPVSSWNFITADQQQAKTPDALRDSFETALSYDTCETKVDAGEPAAAYLTAFGPSSITNLPNMQPEDQYEQLQAAQDKLKQQLTFVKPPQAEYNALLQDINRKKPVVPFKRYQAVLDEVLSGYDITAVYGWDADTADPNLAKIIKPLSAEALEQSPQARQAIMRSIRELLPLPVELVKMAGRHRELLGDVRDSHGRAILASTAIGGSDIYLDVVRQPLSADNFSIMGHELAHGLADEVCGPWYDLAYASLNGKGFEYGEDTERLLSYLKSPYATLQQTASGDKKMVMLNRPYGGSLLEDDIATNIGEGVLPGRFDTRLFDPTINTEVLKKKIALELARLGNKDPRLEQYYENAIAIARIKYETVSHLQWPGPTSAS